MAPGSARPKLIAIVGPTAGGKSDLAMKIAQEFNGEIICADSRTVYKAMDIGTAKPSQKDQAQVRHHLLDVVEPGQRFTAADFKVEADKTIDEIITGAKLPIMVGGSGLYIDAVLYGFGFSKESAQRDTVNPRHLSPTEPRVRRGLKPGTTIIGLMPNDEILRQRINKRAEAIFRSGVVSETRKLLEQYGRQNIEKTAGIVYRICLDIVGGKLTKEQGVELFKTADWQYARRQKTWFKRNKFIKWFNSSEQAYRYIKQQLNT